MDPGCYCLFGSGRRVKVEAARNLYVRVGSTGKIDRDRFWIDGSSVRTGRAATGTSPADGTAAEPADHGPYRSRGGSGSKLNPACDGNGPLKAIRITAGQQYESPQLEALLGQVRFPVPVDRP
jgi:hypothetical protein